MGKTIDGWIDITHMKGEAISLMDFSQIVYSENLTKQEIKDMYPDLYAQHFDSGSNLKQELEKSIDAALEIGNPEIQKVRKEAAKSISTYRPPNHKDN